MKLTKEISEKNYKAFLWHAVFLSIAMNFMDIDTIVPSMLIKAGGSSLHIGIMTAILLGGSSFSQIFFSLFIQNQSKKKPFLIMGINVRIISLLSLGLLFIITSGKSGSIMWWIFFFIILFSFSGAFSNISYIDILGKSILSEKRKRFFSLNQTIRSVAIFLTVFIVRYIINNVNFPANYSMLLIIAGISLFIGSIGFWRINEFDSISLKISGFKNFFRKMSDEIKNNRRVLHYLFIINTLGVGLSIPPFLLLFAKESFGANVSIVGNLLLFKTIGLILAGFIMFKLSSIIKYGKILYFSFYLALSLPFIAFFLKDLVGFYPFVFFISGVFSTLFRVTKSGILLEISTNSNRSLYAGLSGSGNILTMVFPFIGGLMISKVGFIPFFILYIVVILLSYKAISGLRCKK